MNIHVAVALQLCCFARWKQVAVGDDVRQEHAMECQGEWDGKDIRLDRVGVWNVIFGSKTRKAFRRKDA